MKTWVTSGGCTITRVIFGRSNVFLLSKWTSRLLVDTGWSGDGKQLLKRFGQTGPPDTVIMTHTHFDHAGNAGRLHEQFSPVFIVQESEKEFLESGNSPIPKGTMGWTRFLYNLGAERVPQWFHVSGVKADIVFKERYDLTNFGSNTYVIHTPGHSKGSSCVVIDNEIALAGDTIGGLPGLVFPPWGDNADEIILSWQKLLNTGCHTFHPSHGFPVSRKMLANEYEKKSGDHLTKAAAIQ